MNTIDLHMHSKHSLDGEKEVQELIDIAAQHNISTIAIADHNTTRAYHDVIDHKNVTIIPAIELDCTFQDKDFHLLGYHIDPSLPVWEDIHKDVERREKSAGIQRLEFIRNTMGIIIDQARLDALCPNGVYEAESVCEVALEIEENRNNPYLQEFYADGCHSTSPLVDFFWTYCAKGKIAYAPIEYMRMEDAIALYRQQNAMIVLAHPGNNTKEDISLLEDIIKLGIDGLEVYSSYHTQKQIDFYLELADQHHLHVTCGSDYHGKSKPHVKMGQCHMPKDREIVLQDTIKKWNV